MMTKCNNTSGAVSERAYAFSYDELSRLTGSSFTVGSGQFSNDYTEQLTYDEIGRIQTLKRYAGQGLMIDDLYYAHSGARLQQIEDNGTPAGVASGLTKYTYDANGNVITEGATRIAYNLLNLPRQVQLTDRLLQFTYAADGRKLIYEVSDTKNPYIDYKTYSGNLVFDMKDALDHIVIPEGRIVHSDGNFTFEYHLRDHLGNTRVAFTPPTEAGEAAVVVQENTYYPFGAPIKDFTWSGAANKNRYLREGKEYLAEHEWNKYDFTGRTFDPWTAQALQVDPMAEKYYSISPYALWAGNPLRFVDPTGRTLEERLKAINYMRSVLGTPYKDMDCSAAVGKAIVSAGLADKKVGKGVNGIVNGVALIAGNSSQISIADIEEGSAVTFRSGRSDHKGTDGEFDHIGVVTSIVRDSDTDEIVSFGVIHATSSKGIYEQTYDMKKGMPGFQLKNAYKWDTPDISTESSSETFIGPAPPQKTSEKLKESRMPIVQTIGELLSLFGL